MTRIALSALLVGLSAIVVFSKEEGTELAECVYTSTPIKIDGLADDAGWKSARVIENFSVPWLRERSRPAQTKTRARLLWDNDYLYFHAEMEDTDLYADITEHDGPTWTNDVFELFFKPSTDKPGYYEFEVNATNTRMEMYMPRRGTGQYQRYKNDRNFNWKTSVKLRGTLNKWSDVDRSWSVEGRIPWSDFEPTGGRPTENDIWTFALCRVDISVEREGAELSTNAPMKSKPYADFHLYEDYAPLKFVGRAPPANSK